MKGIPTFEFLAQRRRDAELFLTELTEFGEFLATDGGANGIGMGVRSISGLAKLSPGIEVNWASATANITDDKRESS